MACALIRRKREIAYKKKALERLDTDHERETKVGIEADLHFLEETIVNQTRVVEKAKRVNLLRARKSELESVKRKRDSFASAAAGLSPDLKKGGGSPTKMTDTQISIKKGGDFDPP